MFWRKNKEDPNQKKLIDLGIEFVKIQAEMKEIRDNLEKLEIKALESRKVYHQKLKKLYGEEEQKTENSIKESILLSPNGDFI